MGDGSTTWRRQLDGLSDEFTIVAWDAPGASRSSDPPEPFGMAGYANCLAGFVERLGLEEPHVAGLSFGGALALGLYRRHPTVPRTLILASAYAGWPGSLPAEVAAERLQQALVLADLSPHEFVGALLPTMFLRRHTAGVCRCVPREHARVPPGWLPGHGACVRRGPARRTPPGQDPTLLVYADRDVRAPLTVAEDTGT